MFHRGAVILSEKTPQGNPDVWEGWGIFAPVMPGRATSIELGDGRNDQAGIELDPARYVMTSWECTIALLRRSELLGVRLIEVAEFRADCTAGLALCLLRQAALDCKRAAASDA
jgi:hypothetical protein